MKYGFPPTRKPRSTGRTVALRVGLIIAIFLLAGAGALVFGQAPSDQNLRISQVYTRGGESGAAYQKDFIELFNRGMTTVDLNGWSIDIKGIEGFGGAGNAHLSFSGNASLPIGPGRHLLIGFEGSGANGQPLSADIPTPFINLGGSGGQIALIAPGKSLPGGCPASPDQTGAVVDFVGYGTATCAEGSVALAPAANKSLLRIGGGCTDDNNNLNDFSFADPVPRGFNSAATPCGSQPSSIIQFGAPQFDTFEGQGHAQIIVTRSGDVSTPATVDYLVSDGTATERRDYTTALGTLRFAAGETQKTFDVLITDDGAAEPNETASMGLLNVTGAAGIGVRSSAQLIIHDNDSPGASNPIDASSFFVLMHYNDFLNREADGPGQLFWTNNIESCGANATCREVARVNTSAAFFLSIEFQRTGFLVYRLYKASLPATTQRPRALPRYREFIRDTGEISRGVVVGASGWEQALEANTLSFLNSFVIRAEFLAQYPTNLRADEYVNKLNTQAGGVLSTSERDALVAGVLNGQETRASVLRKIAENSVFSAAEFNRAFVLMQYFGYLRRNPDDAPDSNFVGFDFWLTKLNSFGGNYNQADMVKAFITSTEFRNRFIVP
jgi:hypothetical protein